MFFSIYREKKSYSIYNFGMYWLFLSENCINLHSVVDTLVDFESNIYPGVESR